MFGLLRRRKAARVAADAEAGVRDVSAGARRKRVFDRTVMTPDIVDPLLSVRPARETFGLKPADD